MMVAIMGRTGFVPRARHHPSREARLRTIAHGRLGTSRE
jgi:hypothetical protein